mmetsp:Transcript_39681/g.60795  ORF Transcript_39681/g.60795 Transcript_39681/m.60795 type:complete len:108 (+) Transcript_39681:132-455(+)
MQNGKITSKVLIDTFTNLNLLSSIDYKITLKNWIDQSVKVIPGMTEADATIYYFTYRNLLQDIDPEFDHDQQRHLPLNQYQVDVRCFGLFIALQLFASHSKMTSDAR